VTSTRSETKGTSCAVTAPKSLVDNVLEIVEGGGYIFSSTGASRSRAAFRDTIRNVGLDRPSTVSLPETLSRIPCWYEFF